MALSKSNEAVEGVTRLKSSKTKRVLEEDAYLEALEKIIQRDFYPDLEKLQLRKEYLEALDNDDVEKLREIELKIQRTFHTPFQTFSESSDMPCPAAKESRYKPTEHFCENTPPTSTSGTDSAIKSSVQRMDDSDLSLDKFLQKNTSEDNASFSKIMEETRKKHREKYAWMFDGEKEQNEKVRQILALPGPGNEQQKAIENRPTNLDTWTYKSFNSLMYVPDGVPLDINEQINDKSKEEKEICHKNTRFQGNPFDLNSSKATLIEAMRDNSAVRKKMGKVGIDGKLQDDSPKVQGYGFIATPSPAPGVDESPLMTWGEVADTPLKLENPSETPGPTFKIPEPPKREVIGHQLVDKISKQHRDKRKQAYDRVTSSLGSRTPRQFSVEQFTHLSPVAQKLVKGSIRLSSDKALRASYSPSPQRKTPSHNKTPAHTNTPNRRSTRKANTPTLGRTETSLTDNLLQLPET